MIVAASVSTGPDASRIAINWEGISIASPYAAQDYDSPTDTGATYTSEGASGFTCIRDSHVTRFAEIEGMTGPNRAFDSDLFAIIVEPCMSLTIPGYQISGPLGGMPAELASVLLSIDDIGEAPLTALTETERTVTVSTYGPTLDPEPLNATALTGYFTQVAMGGGDSGNGAELQFTAVSVERTFYSGYGFGVPPHSETYTWNFRTGTPGK
jgi:hypothetical protein